MSTEVVAAGAVVDFDCEGVKGPAVPWGCGGWVLRGGIIGGGGMGWEVLQF